MSQKKIKITNLPQKIDILQLDLAVPKFSFFYFNCNFNLNSDFNNFDLIIHVFKNGIQHNKRYYNSFNKCQNIAIKVCACGTSHMRCVFWYELFTFIL